MKSAIRNWVRLISIITLTASGCLTLAAQEDAEGPTLTIGSQAPELDIEHWISDGNGRFKPFTKFEKGHIYIVEFWATWCGPCIAGMPHLAELQTNYAGKNVQFIGVSDEDLPTVEEFLKRRFGGDEEKPTYGEITSAYCLTTDPDRSVLQAYMNAAVQRNIPCAFIIGKTGLIEWIGHLMDMDKPLQQVIDDQWDRDAYLAEFRVEQEEHYLQEKIGDLARTGKVDEALALIAKRKIDAKDDPVMTEKLEEAEFEVKLDRITRKLNLGSNLDEVLKELDAFESQSTPEQRARIEMGKIQLFISAASSDPKYVERTVASLNALFEKQDVDPWELNTYARYIFKSSQSKADYPKEIIAVAIKAAERSVKDVPNNPALIATLAQLVYIQGDVQRAIELRNDAVNKAMPEAKEGFQKLFDKLTAENKKSEDQ